MALFKFVPKAHEIVSCNRANREFRITNNRIVMNDCQLIISFSNLQNCNCANYNLQIANNTLPVMQTLIPKECEA